MKVDINGDWKGLAPHEDLGCVWLDNNSSLDGWQIGYDIVFRIIFLMEREMLANPGFRARFESDFKSAFGLSDDHFITGPLEGGSVFWRIYWDKQGFDLRLVDKCLENLDSCAEENEARVIHLGVTIIPRSMAHIEELVKANKVDS
jgi:hypothetical protein